MSSATMPLGFNNIHHKGGYVKQKKKASTGVVPRMSRPYNNTGQGGTPPPATLIPPSAYLGAAASGGKDPNSFRARPIKHWRKQLFSSNGPAFGRSSYVGVFDKPGGINHLNNKTSCKDCDILNNGLNSVKYSINHNLDSSQNNFQTGNKCCNPEANRIKSRTTLSKKYYTSSSAYLRGRCNTFKQRQFNFLNKSSNSQNNEYDANCCCTNMPDSCTKDNNCRTTIYKPSNAKFATQGAVSGSSRTARLKYDTITGAGNAYYSAYGDTAVVSAATTYSGRPEAPFYLKSKEQVCDPSLYRTHRNKTVDCNNTSSSTGMSLGDDGTSDNQENDCPVVSICPSNGTIYDCTDQVFTNTDFTGCSGEILEGADFTQVSLIGANFSGVDLTGAICTNANLTNATLSNADLATSKFNGATLSGATLENVHIATSDFSGADLSGADLSGANLQNTNLTNADLTNANLTNASLTGATLTGADFSNATLHGIDSGDISGIPSALPTDWIILNGYLIGPYAVFYQSTDFSGVDLSNANFTGAKIIDVDFTNATLTDVSFTYAYIERAIFTDAKLSGASFLQAANSSDCSFQNANLINADFRSTDLIASNFTNAILDKTNFTDAKLNNTIVMNTNLSDAILSNTLYDELTIFPDGTYCTDPSFVELPGMCTNDIMCWKIHSHSLTHCPT